MSVQVDEPLWTEIAYILRGIREDFDRKMGSLTPGNQKTTNDPPTRSPRDDCNTGPDSQEISKKRWSK